MLVRLRPAFSDILLFSPLINLKKIIRVIPPLTKLSGSAHERYKACGKCILGLLLLILLFAFAGRMAIDLYKRALRAQFKLTKCFSNMTPKLDTLTHLFERWYFMVVKYGEQLTFYHQKLKRQTSPSNIYLKTFYVINCK